LMYYTIMLIFAPLAMFLLLSKRAWLFVPLISLGIFIWFASPLNVPSTWGSFLIWQVYFFLGLTIGRFRLNILSYYFSLKESIRSNLARAIILAGAVVIATSVLMEYALFPYVNRLAENGWLPLKLRGAYSHLLGHKTTIDFLLVNNRYGILRPLATLVVMAMAYIIYQKYKESLLSKTGNFVIAMGRDTLWIFVAQAIAIPIMAALPITHTNLFVSLTMTLSLVYLMWLVTKRKEIVKKIRFSSTNIYKLAYALSPRGE